MGEVNEADGFEIGAHKAQRTRATSGHPGSLSWKLTCPWRALWRALLESRSPTVEPRFGRLVRWGRAADLHDAVSLALPMRRRKGEARSCIVEWGSGPAVIPGTRLFGARPLAVRAAREPSRGGAVNPKARDRSLPRPLRSLRTATHSVKARLPARSHPRSRLSPSSLDDARSALRSSAPRVPTLLAVSRLST